MGAAHFIAFAKDRDSIINSIHYNSHFAMVLSWIPNTQASQGCGGARPARLTALLDLGAPGVLE